MEHSLALTEVSPETGLTFDHIVRLEELKGQLVKRYRMLSAQSATHIESTPENPSTNDIQKSMEDLFAKANIESKDSRWRIIKLMLDAQNEAKQRKHRGGYSVN